MSEVSWPSDPYDLAKEAMSPAVIDEIMAYRARRLIYERTPHTPERRRVRRAKPLMGEERIVIQGPKLPGYVTVPCPHCGEPKSKEAPSCKRCGIAKAVQTRMARQAARTAAPTD